MKQTWIALTLVGALCVPLAGCAGNKTGSNLIPGAGPTVQVTPDNSFGESSTDAANGGNNVSGAAVGDDNARGVTGRSNTTTGNANDNTLDRIGEGVKDTLDDMGTAARGMAQDAKRMVK